MGRNDIPPIREFLACSFTSPQPASFRVKRSLLARTRSQKSLVMMITITSPYSLRCWHRYSKEREYEREICVPEVLESRQAALEGSVGQKINKNDRCLVMRSQLIVVSSVVVVLLVCCLPSRFSPFPCACWREHAKIRRLFLLRDRETPRVPGIPSRERLWFDFPRANNTHTLQLGPGWRQAGTSSTSTSEAHFPPARSRVMRVCVQWVAAEKIDRL